MTSLVAFSTLAFVVVGTVVGVRLLRLALRTGERPEWLMGLGLLGMTGLSFPIGVLLQTDLLATPVAVVTQAFVLAIFAGSGVCLAAASMVVVAALGENPMVHPFSLIFVSMGGLIASIALMVAFLPPRRIRERLARTEAL